MKGKRRYYRFIRIIYACIDLITINFCLFSRFFFGDSELPAFSEHYSFVLIFNIVWFVIIFSFRAYEIRHVFRIPKVLREIFQAIAAHLLVMSAVIYFSDTSYFSKEDFLTSYGLLITMLPLIRLILLLMLMTYRQKGFNYSNVVFVGADKVSVEFYNYATSDSTLGLRVKGFFDDDLSQAPDNLRLGSFAEIKQYCEENDIDRIYISVSRLKGRELQELMMYADDNMIRYRLFPNFGNLTSRKMELDFIEGVPVLTVRPEPLENAFNSYLKRSFDFVFSLFFLLTIFPFLILILGTIIKLESKGPIFFKQLRTGKDKKPFYCYKFRSMKVNDDSDSVQATKNDMRLTKIGAFMRKTNMDEMPQFINVLKSEMSIIGPRPHMLRHSEEYSEIVQRFYVRHLVKPGISGWAQVRGYRGATEDPELMVKRVEHDVWYLENWSFVLDLKIIYLTIANMFKGEENAY